jgi:hypothetical protein
MPGRSLQLAATFSAISWLDGIMSAAGVLLRIELTIALWPAAFMAM